MAIFRAPGFSWTDLQALAATANQVMPTLVKINQFFVQRNAAAAQDSPGLVAQDQPVSDNEEVFWDINAGDLFSSFNIIRPKKLSRRLLMELLRSKTRGLL